MSEVKTCYVCKKGSLTPSIEPINVQVGTAKVSVDIPSERCDSCEEIFTDAKDMRKANQAVALTVIFSGQVNGQTFRFLRRSIDNMDINLSTADILLTTPETISAWESGDTPVSPMTWAMLSMLVITEINPKLFTSYINVPRQILNSISNPISIPTWAKL